MQTTLAVLLALACSGCALRQRVHIFPRCADGLPPRVFVDQACPPDGICGYTCAPDRWQRDRLEARKRAAPGPPTRPAFSLPTVSREYATE
jgi:hypothetical protein